MTEWLAPNVAALYPKIDVGPHRAFKGVPLEQLPPLAPVDGSFRWLRAPVYEGQPTALVADDGESITEDPRVVAKQFSRLVGQVRAASLELPASFVTFMSTPSFAARMNSVNGGYFEIGKLKDTHVPFFTDPQTFSWVLMLESGGRHSIAFAHPDPDDLSTLVDFTTCAPSFEQFIHRWWIENQIARALLREEPIVDEDLRAYLVATGLAVGR
jgi:hypothetical protein